MDDIQLFLEQDLGKIIIAIVILIVILLVVVISASISNKRKKAKLANTRTLHRGEFEKAAKKRMEYTQTILRDDITKELSKEASGKSDLEQTVVPKKKGTTATERTMELNLESVRRKLIQDERNSDGTAKKADEPLKTAVSSEKEDTISAEIARLEKEAREKEKIRQEEKAKLAEEARLKKQAEIDEAARLKEEARLREEAILKEIEEDDFGTKTAADLVEEEIVTPIQNENIFDEKGYNYFDVENKEDTDIEEVPEIDVWSDDFGAESTFFSLDSVKIDDENIEGITFDEDEIESNATSLFLSINSISATERSVNNIEFVDVEDQSVYVNNFEFGKEYFADLIDNEEDTPKVIFDFGLSSKEDIVTEDKGNVIFGNYSDKDYTYYPEEKVAPTFGNDFYEPSFDDEIDVTVTKAVLVDEEVIISDFEKVNTVIEEVAPQIVSVSKEETEDVVLKSNNEEDSFTVQKPQDNDSFVVDIHSQLDELDTYDVDLLEEFEFTDKNYNYNFNSINVMEEIVEDMLLDDFVEEEDDEYFKYVYQFALLENMIKTDELEVDVDNGVLDYTIVESIDKHLKSLAKKVKEEQDDEDYEIDEEPIETVERLLETNFELDSELMDLTSKVMKNSHTDEEVEDLAYSASSKRRGFVSPIHGPEETEDTSEYFDMELADEMHQANEELEALEIDENELFNLESVAYEAEVEEESEVEDFLTMISEKMDEDDSKEEEEEFLDILKGLIK